MAFLADPALHGLALSGLEDDLLADFAIGLDAEFGPDLSLRIAADAQLSEDYTSFGGIGKIRIGF